MIRRYSLLPLAILILSVLLGGCTSQRVWEIPIEKVRADLRESRYGFLESIDLAEYPDGEVLRLGAEAPFYLALILKEQKRDAVAEQMLRLLCKRGSSHWRAEATNRLLTELLERDRYEEAAALASEYLKKKRFFRHYDRIKKMYVESLYWQYRDEEVLKNMHELFTEEEITADAELTLFRSVSSCRLDAPGWTSQFVSLFLKHPPSAIHARAYGFLEQEPSRLSGFAKESQDLLRSKYLLATGENLEGSILLNGVINEIARTKPESLKNTDVIRELGYGYLLAGSFVEGAKALENLSSQLDGTEKLQALEMAGRLYRKAGLIQLGISHLKAVAGETRDPEQRDRSLWFVLDMSLAASEKQGVQEIERAISDWNDPSYFDDLMDRLISIMMERGDVEGLLGLYQRTYRASSPYTASRLYFILLRSNKENLPSPSIQDLRLSAETANALVRTLYYERLTSHMKGGEPAALVSDAEKQSGRKAEEKDSDRKKVFDSFVMGYFDYGLYGQGYQALQETLEQNPASVSLETLLESARRLEQAGYYTEAMRLMNYYLVKKPERPTHEEWKLAYPKAFGELIEEAAKKEKIPPWLLFSVVREESYFDSSAGSTAGAVGLMQLMEETAQDMAKLLRIKEYDLENPAHNLRLGARYLSRLHQRFESWPRALMAYNAGPSRVRRWGRRYNGLADEMIVESIPLPETRHFVRKVLVSALMYALLYNSDTKPEEVINLFYPSLREAASPKTGGAKP